MEHSPKYELVKRYYDKGLWTAEMVTNAGGRWITKTEVKKIVGA